jgi:hypothetical protein
VYLLVFHAYINELHGSRSKIPSKKFHPYIYDVKFLALLGAPYIYDISRLRVKGLISSLGIQTTRHKMTIILQNTGNSLPGNKASKPRMVDSTPPL